MIVKKIGFFIAALFVAAAAWGQAVSAPDAIERALALTGGGSVSSLELVPAAGGGSAYRLVIVNGPVTFDVSIHADTGAVLSLSSDAVAGSAAPPAAAAQPAQAQAAPPSPPAQQGRRRVSREEAQAIALAHVGGGVANWPSRDFERFRRVWSVEIFYAGLVHEVYVHRRTGQIVAVEIDRWD